MKLKISVLLLSASLISVLLFNRCGSNKMMPDVCFKKNVLPIFASKCSTSGCHDGNGKGEAEGNFGNYEGIMKKVTPYHPLQSEIYMKCRGKNPEMPPKSSTQLTSTELEYIKYWIHTGAKNSECSNVCDTIGVTYSGRIQPLLDSWCVGCHNANNSGGGYNLSNYQGAKSAVPRLIGCLKGLNGFSPMPQNSSPLNSCDIIAVQKWIDAGSPNN
ncbi:MAG: hypothetical protein IT236_19360 [Bacteroidia bacterium]|nr:hypothetical protein [Bacteroidia bacterium]